MNTWTRPFLEEHIEWSQMPRILICHFTIQELIFQFVYRRDKNNLITHPRSVCCCFRPYLRSVLLYLYENVLSTLIFDNLTVQQKYEFWTIFLNLFKVSIQSKVEFIFYLLRAKKVGGGMCDQQLVVGVH